MKFKDIGIEELFFSNETTIDRQWIKYRKIGPNRAFKLSMGGLPFGTQLAFSENENVQPGTFQPPPDAEVIPPPTTAVVRRDRRVVLMTTRMFQVANYSDGTAELVGCTFLPHPTLEITGDGTLQNPFKIVEQPR